MVLCLDDGNFAVESALVLHGEEHGHGTDHHSHEFPVDSEHDDLHAALGDCTDVTVSRSDQRLTASPVFHPSDVPTPACLVTFAEPQVRRAFFGIPDAHYRGTAARVTFACLSSVVLLV
jgi:hypothetical protein